MSVIASSARKPRRWLHLWPLALFFIVGRVRRAVVMAGLAAGYDEKHSLAA